MFDDAVVQVRDEALIIDAAAFTIVLEGNNRKAADIQSLLYFLLHTSTILGKDEGLKDAASAQTFCAILLACVRSSFWARSQYQTWRI